MAEYPPYVGATGVLNSVLKKIIEAPPPPRFTQDFLTAKLGFKKGSGNAVIPFLKRIGFLGSDGVPTELYSRFPALVGVCAVSARVASPTSILILPQRTTFA